MMTVLIFGVYLKSIDIKKWRKIPVKMEAGGELLAVTEIENIPRVSGRTRPQKQTNLFKSHHHNQTFSGDC